MDVLEIYGPIAESLGISVDLLLVFLSLIAVWTYVWKGFALWRAVGKKHIVWFVLILVLNTVGILEILYIFLFSKISLEKESKNAKKTKKARSKR